MNAMYNLSKLGGFAQIMYLVTTVWRFFRQLVNSYDSSDSGIGQGLYVGPLKHLGKPSTKQAPIVWTLPTLTYRHFKCLICAAEQTL